MSNIIDTSDIKSGTKGLPVINSGGKIKFTDRRNEPKEDRIIKVPPEITETDRIRAGMAKEIGCDISEIHLNDKVEEKPFNPYGPSEAGLKTEAEKIAKLIEKDKKLEAIQKIANSERNRYNATYVDEHEEEEVTKLIEDLFGFEPPRMSGWQMAVKIYDRSEDSGYHRKTATGEISPIVMPESMTNLDRYRNCVGLVVSMGRDCYTDSRFNDDEGVEFVHGGISIEISNVGGKSVLTLFQMEPWYLRLARLVLRIPKPEKPKKKRTRFPLCKVGDWVCFPRNEGTQLNYKGAALQFIEDQKIYCTLQQPSDITRD